MKPASVVKISRSNIGDLVNGGNFGMENTILKLVNLNPFFEKLMDGLNGGQFDDLSIRDTGMNHLNLNAAFLCGNQSLEKFRIGQKVSSSDTNMLLSGLDSFEQVVLSSQPERASGIDTDQVVAADQDPRVEAGSEAYLALGRNARRGRGVASSDRGAQARPLHLVGGLRAPLRAPG